MSIRGSLVSNPGSKAKLISETKSYIPLAWIALLSSDDVSNAVDDGVFELDRKQAISRAEQNIPFLSTVFTDLESFGNDADALIQKLSKLRSKSIGIDLAEFTEFAEDQMPGLDTIVGAMESNDG